MKKRFRKLVREGWHVAKLDRANLWNWQQANNNEDMGDAAHYRHIRAWCNKTYAKDSWEGRLLHSYSNGPTKEFIFKNERDKTLFVLKWS